MREFCVCFAPSVLSSAARLFSVLSGACVRKSDTHFGRVPQRIPRPKTPPIQRHFPARHRNVNCCSPAAKHPKPQPRGVHGESLGFICVQQEHLPCAFVWVFSCRALRRTRRTRSASDRAHRESRAAAFACFIQLLCIYFAPDQQRNENGQCCAKYHPENTGDRAAERTWLHRSGRRRWKTGERETGVGRNRVRVSYRWPGEKISELCNEPNPAVVVVCCWLVGFLCAVCFVLQSAQRDLCATTRHYIYALAEEVNAEGEEAFAELDHSESELLLCRPSVMRHMLLPEKRARVEPHTSNSKSSSHPVFICANYLQVNRGLHQLIAVAEAESSAARHGVAAAVAATVIAPNR